MAQNVGVRAVIVAGMSSAGRGLKSPSRPTTPSPASSTPSPQKQKTKVKAKKALVTSPPPSDLSAAKQPITVYSSDREEKPAICLEKVKYLGAKSCDGQPTEENLKMAVKELRQGKTKAKQLLMHMDPTCLKLIDPKTRDVRQTAKLSDILCWNAYQKDKNSKFLVYMASSGDDRVEVRQCHVVVVKGGSIPMAIKLAIANLTSNADFGTMVLPTGEEVPKPPPRMDEVAAYSKEVYVNTTWRFQCDVTYYGIAKTKEEPSTVALANVSKRISAINKGRSRRLSKAKVEDRTCFPMNDMAVTLAATDRSLRILDRVSGRKIDQVLLANISFAHADDSKEPFVGVFVNRNGMSIKTCYIFKVALRDGQALVRELASMAQQSLSETTAEKLQEADPFAALPNAPRERVPGLLHKMQIHRADLKAEKILGSGQFGEVYLAFQSTTNKKTGAPKTVKRAVKMLKNTATADAKTEFVHECDMMVEAGQHKNLVKMVGVALQQAPWLCVLEFLPNGDLQGLLQDLAADDIQLELGVMLDFCRQLCDGGAHLASRRLVHMDLAARNILVGKGNVLKIADLGLTHKMCDEGSYYVLPQRIPLALKWLSPEAMESLFFSEYSDVWAMAVTMWEIFMYGAMPFRNVTNANIFLALKGGLRLQQPSNMPESVYKTLSICWLDEMNKRPTFKALGKALEPFVAKYPAVDATQADIGSLRK